jgi:hypothetical protein
MQIHKSIAVPVKRAKAKRKAEGPALPVAVVEAPRVAPAVGRVVTPPVHRFGIGETLHMTNGGRTFSRAASRCVVVSRLPHEGHGHLLYRVRSESEHHERVVAEMDLARPDDIGLD